MTQVLTSKLTRWLAIPVAIALVLAFMVGSEQPSAQAIGPGETDVAYVADGYDFPDALVGATVAALNAAPMLGVRGPDSGNFVPEDTADELDRLTNNKSNPLATIYIFGGPAAVSDDVASELEQWANDVQRIQGDDRFGTMKAISEALPSKMKDSDLLDGKDSTEFVTKGDTVVTSMNWRSNAQQPVTLEVFTSVVRLAAGDDGFANLKPDLTSIADGNVLRLKSVELCLFQGGAAVQQVQISVNQVDPDSGLPSTKTEESFNWTADGDGCRTFDVTDTNLGSDTTVTASIERDGSGTDLDISKTSFVLDRQA